MSGPKPRQSNEEILDLFINALIAHEGNLSFARAKAAIGLKGGSERTLELFNEAKIRYASIGIGPDGAVSAPRFESAMRAACKDLAGPIAEERKRGLAALELERASLLREVEEQRLAMREDLEEAKRQVNEAREERSEAQKRVMELHARISELNSERGELRGEVEGLRRQNAELSRSLQRVSDERHQKIEEMLAELLQKIGEAAEKKAATPHRRKGECVD